MNAPCYQHPARFATSTCAECERPICAECTQFAVDRPVCTSCTVASNARNAGLPGSQTMGAAPTPSAVPLNVPRPAASAIPMNVPRGNTPASPPGYGSPAPYAPAPTAQPLGGPAGYAPTPTAQPPGGSASYAPAPTLQPLYSPPDAQNAPVAQPLYGQAGYGQPVAPQAAPLYGQQAGYGPPTAAPNTVQPGYGQAGQPAQTGYGQQGGYGQQASGYRPLTAQVTTDSGPNTVVAVLIGLLMVGLVGAGFGFASAAMGMRFPFLSVLTGTIVGNAIKAAARGTGTGIGIICAICSLFACLVAYGVMILNGYMPGGVAWALILIAVWRGYRVGSGESGY